MYTRLLNIWEHFRASFWFVPSIMMFFAATSAMLLVRIDANLGKNLIETYPIMELSPPSARSILSSIVGAMVTSTGVVFSMTIVALTLASSQFGSRLVRTYRNRKSTHFTLGIFVSTSLFCILVLASIREVDGYRFVPTIAVATGIVLTVVCLATLIYYIHDISKAIEAPNVILSSAKDLDKAIDRMFPTRIGHSADNDERTLDGASEAHASDGALSNKPLLKVAGDRCGYIQGIENDSIMELAVEWELVIRLLVQPGDFVYDQCPLAEIRVVKTSNPDLARVDNDQFEQIANRLRSTLIIGADRTPTQDIRYAFNELVEVAVRALSPGINDPFTAITCVDRIQAALLTLRKRQVPSAFRLDESNQLRVIAEPVPFKECFEGSLRVIEHYADDSPLVKRRVRNAIREVEQSSFYRPGLFLSASLCLMCLI